VYSVQKAVRLFRLFITFGKKDTTANKREPWTIDVKTEKDLAG
jgi:hypothetical protein